MSSQRQQYASDLSPNPQQRQQQYQEYPSYPSRSANAPPYLDAPPRANSDSSSSLYSLSAYSTDIQGQPIQSPYVQTSGLQPLHASASTGSSQSEGGGQKAMNLDDYLEELRGGGDQRGLAGLGITGDAGAMGSLSAPVSGKASPANITGGSHPASRSNTYDSTSIPLSSSMSSTTSSLSQYSMQQSQIQGSGNEGSASPIVPGSLPERDSSLQHIPTASDLAVPAPQMQKLSLSERERDLRRISSDSAGSNDTYSGQTGAEGRDLDMRTPTGGSMTGGQNVKQENLPSRLNGASYPVSTDTSGSAQQSQPKIGMPGGTPLFDLSSAATFAGPPIDISDGPTSSASAQHMTPQNIASPTSSTLQPQIPHQISSPATTSASTSNASDYLTAASSTGTKAAMASMGGVAGLGIGVPQGGGFGSSPSESRLTFDEGLLRTLCDLDVSTLTDHRCNHS